MALGPEGKAFYSQWATLTLCDGLLYHQWQTPDSETTFVQLLVPHSLWCQVLRLVHGSVGTGHFGVAKTLRRLRSWFYWPGCRLDIELYVHCCDACTAKKGPTQRPHVPLQQYLPKWLEAYAIPDLSAATMAEKLVAEMFCRFGAPDEIHSDQGCNSEAEVFHEVCYLLGICKTHTTPLHPQSDGLVECFNHTLTTQLAILTSEHQCDWDRHIHLALWAYRMAVQESTGCTPAALRNYEHWWN